MREKTIVYSSEKEDDFAPFRIQNKPLPENYRYSIKNPIGRAVSFFLYYFAALPIAYLYMKIRFRQKIVGRDKLKPYRKTGYYLYGNHTRAAGDAFTPGLVSFPKRSYIVAHSDAASLFGLRFAVKALGCLPIPQSGKKMRDFLESLREAAKEGKVVSMYPEAHIWPFYTGIRPFPAVSFHYPAESGKAIFTFTTVYKKPRIGRFPKTIVYIDGPFFASPSRSIGENKDALRDEAYAAMLSRAALSDYEYVCYVKREGKE